MDNIQDLLSSAIVKIKQKVTPLAVNTPLVSIPSQPYEQLYPLLEVFDSAKVDPDIQKQVQYIYDYLDTRKGSEGHRDMIMHILTRLGPTPATETRLGRVYRFCKLHKQSESLMQEYEVLQGEIHALGNHR